MDFLQAIILGIVEGLTEFLPVSSTGHLTITEKLLGLSIDDDAVTAFTAVIQMGAIVAVILYFRKDIVEHRGRLVPRDRRPGGPRRLRLPDGLVRHRRVDPGRDRRAARARASSPAPCATCGGWPGR